MTRFEWSRVRPLLARLWELPEEQHGAFLEEACGDERLARRVREMFRRERDESTFLESPLTSSGSVEPGARLGPYRLLRELGSGGMGAVWLAERDDGTFQKQVAVKLLKSGLHTDDVLQRFRNERQVLAWLDHPGIARLIDGGRSEQGLPFLVMEHVDGVPIDRACDEQGLAIEGRLELFLDVCDAVQHAHERGVVHRDLKPSNVLVDGEGRARLLDFGIAKVLGADSEEDLADLTRTGQRLYSPNYAPPEQVRGEDATAASDVYSLGVVLFELLTGRRPYRVLSVSQFELERVVCEEEPDRPSTSTGTTVKDDPGSGPWSTRGFGDEHGLRRRLAGDLDWILLACLRKEPERRYASVAALAADLRRHLAGEAIEARPESTPYRASRFVRRNRALVASFAAVLVVVSVALVVALGLLADARRAEERRSLEAYTAGLQAAEGAIRANDLGLAEAALERTPPEQRGWEWRHLVRRLDRSMDVLATPANQLLDGIACDEAGRFALVGYNVSLVDPRTGTVRKNLIPHQESLLDGGTTHASFHPVGDVFVAVMFDHRARVFDAQSLRVLHELDEEAVRGVAFSPDGDHIALVRDDGEAVLLVWPSLQERARWSTGVDRPYYVRFAPTSEQELLAFAGWDEDVRLWRIEADEPHLAATLVGHTMEIRSLAFASSGDTLATASLDRTVRIWDLDAPEKHPLVFRGHETSLDAVLFHPRDGTVVSKDANGEILGWDPESGTVRNRIRAQGPGAIGISPDGVWIVVSENAEDNPLRSWPAGSDDVLTLQACEFANAVAFTPDGTTLFCSAPDGYVRRWSRTGEELPRFGVDSTPLRMCVNLDAGLVAACLDDGRLALWDLDGRPRNTLEVGLLPGQRTRVDVRGSMASVCGLEGGVGRALIIDLEDGRVLAEVAFEEREVWTALWVDDDELVVIGTDAVWSWAPFDGAEPRRLASPVMSVAQAALEPRGERVLIAAAFPPSVRLVDTRTGAVTELADPGTACASVAWHPREPRFAIGYYDGSTGIWDAERLHELVRLRGHQGSVRSLQFSPDGELLASCSDDGLVKVWDAPRSR